MNLLCCWSPSRLMYVHLLCLHCHRWSCPAQPSSSLFLSSPSSSSPPVLSITEPLSTPSLTLLHTSLKPVIPSAIPPLAPFSPSPSPLPWSSDLPWSIQSPAPQLPSPALGSASSLRTLSSTSDHRIIVSAMAPRTFGSNWDLCPYSSSRLSCPTGCTLASRCPNFIMDLRAVCCAPSLHPYCLIGLLYSSGITLVLWPSGSISATRHLDSALVSPSVSVTTSLIPSDVAWVSPSPSVTSVGQEQITTLPPPSITATMDRLRHGPLSESGQPSVPAWILPTSTPPWALSPSSPPWLLPQSSPQWGVSSMSNL